MTLGEWGTGRGQSQGLLKQPSGHVWLKTQSSGWDAAAAKAATEGPASGAAAEVISLQEPRPTVHLVNCCQLREKLLPLLLKVARIQIAPPRLCELPATSDLQMSLSIFFSVSLSFAATHALLLSPRLQVTKAIV